MLKRHGSVTLLDNTVISRLAIGISIAGSETSWKLELLI